MSQLIGTILSSRTACTTTPTRCSRMFSQVWALKLSLLGIPHSLILRTISTRFAGCPIANMSSFTRQSIKFSCAIRANPTTTRSLSWRCLWIIEIVKRTYRALSSTLSTSRGLRRKHLSKCSYLICASPAGSDTRSRQTCPVNGTKMAMRMTRKLT